MGTVSTLIHRDAGPIFQGQNHLPPPIVWWRSATSLDFVTDLHQRKVQFRSLTDGIDTTTPAGRFFFHVMASPAQMERELLAERTRAGLAAARRRGRVGGRKRRMTPGKVESARKLLKGGMAPRDVAQNLGVSIPTLYRWVPAASL